MRTLVAPEDLGRAADALTAGVDDLEDSLRGADPTASVALALRTGLEIATTRGPSDLRVGITAGHLVARIERRVLTAVADARLEVIRLGALAAGLRQAARAYAAAEEAVGAAVLRLDLAVHDHPEVLQWLADHGHRHLLGPILRVGEPIGVLTEHGDRVVAVDAAEPRATAAPTGLGDLIADTVSTASVDGRVRVTEVVGADGASTWIVAISGTQSWSPVPGENPFDLTADVRAIREEATAAGMGVHLALLHAQQRSGRDTRDEPVMLVGHSLGGLLATALAADPAFRRGRSVTAVVTAGAPTGRINLPPSIGVIAIEHAADPVPRLDGTPARQGGSWHTFVRDVDPAVSGGRGTATHAGQLHVDSARAIESGSPADEDWRSTIAPFVAPAGGHAIARDYVVTRQWQNPRS